MCTMVFFILCASACTTRHYEQNSPQGVLSEYISRSFSVSGTADKAKLIEMTTAEVKNALEKLDDESFKKYFLQEKKQFLSMKIKDERKITDEKYSITYELTYLNTSSISKDKVTNKKHALFEKNSGKWLISEVRNIKTSIEHQNDLSF
jgi:hypothetical protein